MKISRAFFLFAIPLFFSSYTSYPFEGGYTPEEEGVKDASEAKEEVMGGYTSEQRDVFNKLVKITPFTFLFTDKQKQERQAQLEALAAGIVLKAAEEIDDYVLLFKEKLSERYNNLDDLKNIFSIRYSPLLSEDETVQGAFQYAMTNVKSRGSLHERLTVINSRYKKVYEALQKVGSKELFPEDLSGNDKSLESLKRLLRVFKFEMEREPEEKEEEEIVKFEIAV